MATEIDLPRSDLGTLAEFTFPGGYPLYYVVKDGGVLCPKCARMAESEGLTDDPDDPQWCIIACDINYEDDTLYCDHCGDNIESAYGDN